MKFKVGDVVECTEYTRYSITDVGVPCVVVKTESGSDSISVKVIGAGDTEFWVNSNYFRKVSDISELKSLEVRPFKSVTVNEAKRKITVVYGKGDYQIATCSENDTFDPAIGIALAMAYKAFGSKTKFHKFVKSLTDKK